MVERPRRLRQSVGVRRLVAETRLHPSNLVLPMFVVEGLAEPRPIESMPGVVQHSLASLAEAARQAQQAGSRGNQQAFGKQLADQPPAPRPQRQTDSDLLPPVHGPGRPPMRSSSAAITRKPPSCFRK